MSKRNGLLILTVLGLAALFPVAMAQYARRGITPAEEKLMVRRATTQSKDGETLTVWAAATEEARSDLVDQQALFPTILSACYNDVSDCATSAKYVCDAGGLDPAGHGGVRRVVFSATDEMCTIDCGDGTVATCTRDRH